MLKHRSTRRRGKIHSRHLLRTIASPRNSTSISCVLVAPPIFHLSLLLPFAITNQSSSRSSLACPYCRKHTTLLNNAPSPFKFSPSQSHNQATTHPTCSQLGVLASERPSPTHSISQTPRGLQPTKHKSFPRLLACPSSNLNSFTSRSPET